MNLLLKAKIYRSRACPNRLRYSLNVTIDGFETDDDELRRPNPYAGNEENIEDPLDFLFGDEEMPENGGDLDDDDILGDDLLDVDDDFDDEE